MLFLLFVQRWAWEGGETEFDTLVIVGNLMFGEPVIEILASLCAFVILALSLTPLDGLSYSLFKNIKLN